MSKKIINIFSATLAALLCMSSCALEEPINTPQNSDGVIEFVARPVGFNNQVVETKAAASGDIETKIYSCYLLVFDMTPNTGSGRLIYCSGNLSSNNATVSTGIQSQKLNIDKNKVKSVKACYLVNVPNNFVYNNDNTPAFSNSTALDNAVFAHFNYEDASSTGAIRVPVVSINSEAKQCIPAYGETVVDFANGAGGTIPIIVRRLFAKVVVNLTLDIPDDTETTFTLNRVSLSNLPTKVAITTPNLESSWAGENSTDFAPTASLNKNTTLTSGGATQHILTCYIPEYKVSPTVADSDIEEYDADNAQRYKPLRCPGKRPSYVTIEGSMGNNVYTYDIYLGEDNAKKFDLLRNTQYTNNITITGISSADVDHRVTYTSMPTMLVNGEAANCYIITEPGKYQLDTYEGASKTLSTARLLSGKPRQVWSEIGDITFHNQDKTDSRIIFEISADQFKAGNALIALVDDKGTTTTEDDDEILWSWHLWFCEGSAPGTFKYPAGTDGVQYDIMDRALGATHSIQLGGDAIKDELPTIFQAAWSAMSDALTNVFKSFLWEDALYYQYGRKDPFKTVNASSVSTNDNVTIEDSRKNPTIYYSKWTSEDNLWGGSTKSTYDPCPPGYQVPTESVWRGENPNKQGVTLNIANYDINIVQTTTSSAYTYYISDNLTQSVFYPYTYYINSNGTKASKTNKNESVIAEGFIPSNYEVKSTRITPYKFRNVYYQAPVEEWSGALWNSTENSLSYSYRKASVSSNGLSNFFKQMTITSIQYCPGKCTRSGSIFSGGYTYSYTYDDEKYGESAWKTLDQDKFNNNVFDGWSDKYQLVNAELQDFLEDNGLGGKSYGYDPTSEVRAKSEALPIRCVAYQP